jgi:nucleotide-binding universal stress UspA family protein
MSTVPSPSHQPIPPRARTVVVGIDASDHSMDALRAAARAAQAIDATLEVVSTWQMPPTYGRLLAVMPDFQSDLDAAQRGAVMAAFDSEPPVRVRRLVCEGGAAAVLLEESRDAALLVVGSRGRGGFGGLLLGSVSMSCVVHARCPVLVVHGAAAPVTDTEAHGPRRVVVGVHDAEPTSLAALRAAVRAAQLLDARLDVVTAWSFPSQYTDSYLLLRGDIEEAARESQSKALEAAPPELRPERVNRLVREGSTPAVLVQESVGADLLVVATASRSEIRDVVLGAVGLTVAAHARCPVLVVRGDLPGNADPSRAA